MLSQLKINNERNNEMDALFKSAAIVAGTSSGIDYVA